MSREGTSNIHTQCPLVFGWTQKPKQTGLLKTLLCTLLKDKGKEDVKKAKKGKWNAGNAKSLENVIAIGCPGQTKEGKGDGRQLEENQAGYLWKLESIEHASLNLSGFCRSPS